MLPWRSQASHLTPEPCRLATRHSQNAATHPKSLHCNACNERTLHSNVEGNTHCVRLCARASSTQTIFDLTRTMLARCFQQQKLDDLCVFDSTCNRRYIFFVYIRKCRANGNAIPNDTLIQHVSSGEAWSFQLTARWHTSFHSDHQTATQAISICVSVYTTSIAIYHKWVFAWQMEWRSTPLECIH